MNLSKSLGLAIACSIGLFLNASSAFGESIEGTIDWPDQWTIFQPLERDDPVVDADVLTAIPDTIDVGGTSREAEQVTPEANGTFDFAPLFGEIAAGNTAYVFLSLEAEQSKQITVGLGADWWMQVWLNGEEVLSTLEEGNVHWPPTIGDHQIDIDLREGRNVLAIRFISGGGSALLAVGGPDQLRALPAREFGGGSNPTHGLDAFMRRHGVKPYDLYRTNDAVRSHRLIFEDLDHGTEMWMLDDSPVSDHARTASIRPAWNANATRLWMRTRRPHIDGRGLLMEDNYSRIVSTQQSRMPVWDREDPDIKHVATPGAVLEIDAEADQTRKLAEWEGHYPRQRIYGRTADNRHVFLDTPNGGIWLPYEPGDEPIPERAMHAGRPAGPHADGTPAHPRDDHESWRPEGFIAVDDEHYDEGWGPLVRVRVGKLIDRETGEVDHVIAPLAGYDAYLRLFMGENGRIHFPEGERWDKYRVHKSDDLEEMFDIFSYYPFSTHGHEAISPDGNHIARDGGTVYIWNTRSGARYQTIEVSPDGYHYHMQWSKHPRFFIGWVRGWAFRSFTRPENANLIYQAFSDGTWQPVFNTNHRFNTYYAGGDFSMQSPDMTKIHTASSMTGMFRNYVAVMARPRPPRNVQWTAQGDAIELAWEPPAFSRETRGYLVYRSERSGDDYELLTPEPVRETNWRDEDLQPGQDYYYVVSSLEHSGLESGYSQEAARAGIELPSSLDAPLTIYVEAEESIRDLDADDRPDLAMGRDARDASDLYYIYRHPDVDRGTADLRLRVPDEKRYHVWARVRSDEAQRARWRLDLANETLIAESDAAQWTWVRAGSVQMSAGEATVNVSAGDRGAALDLICLTSAAGVEPDGPRPEHTDPPAPPTALAAENVRERVNRLTWEPADDPTISHYNVYAATDPLEQLAQEHRIASPTEPELIDWGLKAETRYYYAVTAVDRRRNESEPVLVSATTADEDFIEYKIELAFDEAEREGPFERIDNAGGTRAEAYLIPEDPNRNRVQWEIEVPETGVYYFWLRFLQIGDGSRGDTVSQRVDVRLNDESLTTLGGGATDFHASDDLIEPDHPLADRVWTWDRPGRTNLEAVTLPAGQHTLTMENLNNEIRYDVLLITNEPAFQPSDGRLRQALE